MVVSPLDNSSTESCTINIGLINENHYVSLVSVGCEVHVLASDGSNSNNDGKQLLMRPLSKVIGIVVKLQEDLKHVVYCH